MSLLKNLSRIAEDSKKKYEKNRKSEFQLVESPGIYREDKEKEEGATCLRGGGNILALGDNLSFMLFLMRDRGLKGKMQMIYIDPPFFSRNKYTSSIKITSERMKKDFSLKVPAFDDRWTRKMENYLTMLGSRLMYMRDLLAEDGVIWVHLDRHAVHYVKVLMDEIFGRNRFINEIIWQYKSGGSTKKRFAAKHDTILLYGKSEKYKLKPGREKSYNRGRKPYRFKGVEEFEDEGGWYTMVTQKDVWQFDMVGRTSGERTGYATQKPVALLERIVKSSTEPGDLCGDFFCGSGSLAMAAEKLGRKWVCCDEEKLAVAMTEKRIIGNYYDFYIERTKVPQTFKPLDPKSRDPERFPSSEREKLKELMNEDPESLILYRTRGREVDVFGNMKKRSDLE